MGRKRARAVLDGSFMVERILGSRERPAGGTEYQVKWQGYTDADNTWEPAAHLPAQVVAAFQDGPAGVPEQPAQPFQAEDREQDQNSEKDAFAAERAAESEAREQGRQLAGGGVNVAGRVAEAAECRVGMTVTGSRTWAAYVAPEAQTLPVTELRDCDQANIPTTRH